MDSFLFDKRVVRKNIEKGLITQQEYVAYLEGLEDVGTNSQPVEETLYADDDTNTMDGGNNEDAPQDN